MAQHLAAPPPCPAPDDAHLHGLEFLWIELTNQCNLNCVHCYADSSPATKHRDALVRTDYERLLREAADLGCRRLQFIGGEPTLSRDLPDLIHEARRLAFHDIEIFSNLTRLDPALLRASRAGSVRYATSIYARDPDRHAEVTRSPGSHGRTIENLKRLLDSGVAVRASVIGIHQSDPEIEDTVRFLADIGVTQISVDRVRSFGRGREAAAMPRKRELCGNCWRRSLCVSSDASVSLCIMSRDWPVGDVSKHSLRAIVAAQDTITLRREIYDASPFSPSVPIEAGGCGPCGPADCGPIWPCGPRDCGPTVNCNPNQCGPTSQCSPYWCQPAFGRAAATHRT